MFSKNSTWAHSPKPQPHKYRVVTEDVKYSEQRQDGTPTDPTFIYILRVTDGNCAGMRFRKFTTLKTEKNLSFLKGDLSRLGLVSPADPEELINIFQSARGLTIDVTVKSRQYNGETYKDCTIDRLIKKAGPSFASQNNHQDAAFADTYYDSMPY